jgi:hypothetical protein
MKLELLEKAKKRLLHEWDVLKGALVNRTFPLWKEWLVKNDPWSFSNYPAYVTDFTTLKGRLRQKLSFILWDYASVANQQDVALSQTFNVPVEWDTAEQVEIEQRIHGLPILDPEQPMTTEPLREVLNPNGKHFKVVMKRAPVVTVPPTPVMPRPGRVAKKKKVEKAN